MGLTIHRRISTQARVITTLVALFALVAQPTYGLVSAQVANALVSVNTVYVSRTGDDATPNGRDSDTPFKSIQAAINDDATTAGTTILVLQGSYPGDVTVNKGIALVGVSTGAVIQGKVVVTAGGSGATIKSFTINSNLNDNYSIAISKANNVEISNNTISGTRTTLAKTSAKGIFVGDGDLDGVYIHNNYITAIKSDLWGAYGILFANHKFTNVRVENNPIHNLNGAWATAIGLEGDTPYASISGNTITSLSGMATAVRFEKNPSANTITAFAGNTYDGKSLIKSAADVAVNTENKSWTTASTDNSTYPEVLSHQDNAYHYLGLNAFTSVQAGVDAVVPNGFVSLDTYAVATTGIKVNTSGITIDGHNNTVNATYAKTENGKDNAVFIINKENVTLKNTRMTANQATDIHGVVVSGHVQNVMLQNIKTVAVNAAVIANGGAQVTVDGIRTTDGKWAYTMNADGNGTVLTVKGAVVQDDKSLIGIFVDHANAGTVVNVESGRYVRVDTKNKDDGAAWAYLLKSAAPVTPTATLKDAKNKAITNGYIATEGFTFNLASDDATSYKIKYWNEIAASQFNSEASAWPTTRDVNAVYSDKFTQGEGVHYFAFSACNVVGNCSEFSSPYVVTYDKTAPVNYTATIEGQQFVGKALRGDITFDTTVDEAYPNWMHVEYQQLVDNKWVKRASQYSYDVGTGSITVNTKNWVDGTYQLKVNGRDKAENNSSATFGFTVDNTAPIVTVNSYAATNTKPTLTGTMDKWATDVMVKIGDDVAVPATTVDSAAGTWSYTPSTALTTGLHKIVVTAKDIAGNTGTTTTQDADGNDVFATFTITIAKVPNVPIVVTGPTLPMSPELDGSENNAAAPARLFGGGFNTVGASSFVADPAEVLGAQDNKGVDTGILGASKDIAAIAPSAQGWKIFGLAWYWLLLAIAAVAGIWWWIAAARRHSQEA